MKLEAAITPAEVAYLMQALEFQFPELGLGLDDIIATFAGVRPVIDSGKADPSKEARDHAVWLEQGLLTVTGGKLTTFRLIAQDALAHCAPLLPRRRRARTHREHSCEPAPLPANAALTAAQAQQAAGPLRHACGRIARGSARRRACDHRRQRNPVGRTALGGARRGGDAPGRSAVAPHPSRPATATGRCRSAAAHPRHLPGGTRLGRRSAGWRKRPRISLCGAAATVCRRAPAYRTGARPRQADKAAVFLSGCTMPGDYILSIDNGTQSVRALLFDLHGNIVAKSAGASGGLFFRAARLGRAGCGGVLAGRVPCLPAAVGAKRNRAQRVAGVAVTTQRGTVINLDRQGGRCARRSPGSISGAPSACRRSALWWTLAFKLARHGRDGRLLSQAKRKRTGSRPTSRRSGRQTHKYLLLSGYLNYRL